MKKNSIKLGLMPPMTGLVGIYGSEISHAGQVACQEINENGGVLGRPLELIIEDDGSMPDSAVRAANKLIDEHHCAAIIGNLLSNSRISVAYQVAEPKRIPYLNFSFYEGSISSRYFFHFAALPNQQIDKMIPYMCEKFGPRMFFTGHNYEWPRGSIHAGKLALIKSGGTVVGEEYAPIEVEPEQIEKILDQVEEAQPDVFVPYFAGSAQILLLTRFTERGLKDKATVVMGHYDELLASMLPEEVRKGFYSSNTYFMTIDTDQNRDYLSRLATLPDVDGIWPNGNGILTNFGEGTYTCVKAYATAVNQAGTTDSEKVIDALKNVSIEAPQGIVSMNDEHHHARVNTYLSRCEPDGTFSIIEKFGAIEPLLPERYSHQRISNQARLEDDIRLQARMLEQMSEGVVLISVIDKSIIYTNAGAESIFGYRDEGMNGLPFAHLNCQNYDEANETNLELNRILTQKGEWQGESQNYKKNGESIWCDTTFSTFTHPVYGEVWMAVYRDITEKKLAENELVHVKKMLGRANSIAKMGAWDFDLVSNCLIWSDITKDIHEVEHDYVPEIATAINFYKEGYDRDKINQVVNESMQNGKTWDEELVIVTAKGNEKWVRAMGQAEIKDGVCTRLYGSFQDISERKNVESELTHTLSLLHNVINTTPDLIFVKDTELRTVLCNKVFSSAVGKEPEELYGKTDIENGWDPELVKGNAEKNIRGFENDDRDVLAGKTIHNNADPANVNGEIRIFDTVKLPLRNKYGNIIGVMGMSRDITESKLANEALLESEQKFRSTFEQAAVGVAHVALDGGWIKVNSKLCNIVGYKEEELISMTFQDITYADDLNTDLAYLNELIQGKRDTYSMEKRYIKKNGEIVWINLTVSLVRTEEGKAKYFISIVEDIHGRKLAEEKVTELNRQLKQRVSEREKELSESLALVQKENFERKQAEKDLLKAKEEAEHANKLKSEFLGRMSHELRTPMNAILGFGQLLEEEPLTSDQASSMSEIMHAARHLMGLIDEVLDLAKIETGNIDIDLGPVSIAEVIDESLSIASNLAQAKMVKLENTISDEHLAVWADRVRLKEVILNLLSNAIKYNHENGRVVLNATLSAKENMLRINVMDTGKGLDEEKQRFVFEPFNRLGEEYSSTEGTGIGLTITKQLIDLMDGRIGLESVEGEGSTFWIELQLADAKRDVVEESVSHKDEIDVSQAEKTILYIEDNPANMRLVQKVFEPYPSWYLYTAPNAEIGIELARAKLPDLVILDLNLPGMDGYEALTRLRNYPETRNLTYVALSAAAMPRDIERGLLAGFRRYLTKPINLDELREVLKCELGDSEVAATSGK